MFKTAENSNDNNSKKHYKYSIAISKEKIFTVINIVSGQSEA